MRWFDELRDICPLNETAEPIEEIAAADCWTIGEPENILANLQIEFGGNLNRVELKNFFG